MVRNRESHAFADLCLAFGGTPMELPARFGSRWIPVEHPAPAQLSLCVGDYAHDLVMVADVPPCSVWAIGVISGYRGHSKNPLAAFAADLTGDRADPRHLDGRFLLVAHDSSSGSWHVITDRCGTGHVYVGRSGRRVVLSTFSPTAAHGVNRGRLDWEAITGLCGLGFFPGDRTWWPHVSIVRPATWLTLGVDGSELGNTRWWEWAYEPRDRTQADVVDELDEVLRSALEAEVAGQRVVLPISGGLDSRLLAGALGAIGPDEGSPREVNGLTYGYSPDSIETAIGRRVAEASGLGCQSLQVRPYLLDDLDAIVDALDGTLSLSIPRQAGAGDAIAGLGSRVVGGHWGDVWMDAAAPPTPIHHGSLAEAGLAKFRKRGGEWLLQHLCAPQLDGDPDDVLVELIQSEADRIPDLGDSDMNLKALKTEQWSFRWTLASIRAYQLGAFPVLPFYEPRLVDLLLTVPSSEHQGRALQIAWLCRKYPELASVPWQATGRDLVSPPRLLQPFASRAWSKARRTARRERVIERNWEVQLHQPAQRPRLRALIESGPPASVLPQAELGLLLDQFGQSVDPSIGYTVDLLFSISEWLRRYG